MPLVHRLSGIGFASDEDKRRLRESQAAYPFRSPQTSSKPASATLCKLCAARASTFDLSMRCCLDRYESTFGSVLEHRTRFARARACALDGDFMPARRLVESYRRVFGPMEAVELKRRLWQSIADAQVRPDGRAASDGHEEPRASA